MASSIPFFTSLRDFATPKHAGLAISVACFLFGVPFAPAQSQTTHFRSYSSTHYKSATHLHGVDQKPRSLPASGVPELAEKPAGRAATSSSKELDQLERGSLLKPAPVRHASSPSVTKSTFAPEKHDPPINFTHKELPQTPHYAAPKIR